MSKRTALHIILLMLSALLIFHFLVITQIIPFDQVWGGRLKSETEMYRFEGFSVILTTFMMVILGIKYRLMNAGKNNKIINILIWLFAAFFLLNTFGNLMAESKLEMIIGSLFTISAGLLCIVIAKK